LSRNDNLQPGSNRSFGITFAVVFAIIALLPLVLHGEADTLVPIACGRDAAQRIPGARFVSIPGMGHDLPPPVVEILMQHILPFLEHAENRP